MKIPSEKAVNALKIFNYALGFEFRQKCETPVYGRGSTDGLNLTPSYVTSQFLGKQENCEVING
jgi:hypothetical protein